MYIGNEQLLEATTNSRTSQSSDNEIPEIGEKLNKCIIICSIIIIT